jgi:hypothetical protein
MFTSHEYIGLSLEGDFIKVARLKPNKGGFQLVRVDKLKLIKSLKTEKKVEQEQVVTSEDVFSEEDPDSIFGLDLGDDEGGLDTIEEIDLSDIDEEEPADLYDEDLVSEASKPTKTVFPAHP